jgi:hypothetical protein
MSDPNISRVNGVPYSWTSCSHFFAGLPYKGITDVTFKETREAEYVDAAQQDGVPVGITSGMYRVENISFTLLRDSALSLMQDLASLTGTGSYGDAQFNYLLQLFEPVTPASQPQSTLITGCVITGVEDKQAKGSEALVTVFTCKARFLVRAPGLTLFSQARALL